jgi:hypothetical protein
MVFSLEHDIKVTKNHQNLLPTQSVLVAHTVQCHQEAFDVGRRTKYNFFGIWKKEERSQGSIMINYWAHLTMY